MMVSCADGAGVAEVAGRAMFGLKRKRETELDSIVVVELCTPDDFLLSPSCVSQALLEAKVSFMGDASGPILKARRTSSLLRLQLGGVEVDHLEMACMPPTVRTALHIHPQHDTKIVIAAAWYVLEGFILLETDD